jgi:low affinity Fe/Cu permease
VQLKLDELIRASAHARNRLLTIEDLSEEELEELKQSFARVARQRGIGEGVLNQVEADLDNAEEDIDRARGKLAGSRQPKRPREGATN